MYSARRPRACVCVWRVAARLTSALAAANMGFVGKAPQAGPDASVTTARGCSEAGPGKLNQTRLAASPVHSVVHADGRAGGVDQVVCQTLAVQGVLVLTQSTACIVLHGCALANTVIAHDTGAVHVISMQPGSNSYPIKSSLALGVGVPVFVNTSEGRMITLHVIH